MMTPGTIDRQTEKRIARRGDQIVDRVGPDHLLLDLILVPDAVVRATDQKGRGDFDRRLPDPDGISGELLDDESVVGLVLVERADHIVAVAPEIVDDVVLLKALALPKSRDVEPVAAPLLAIVRAGEQSIDLPFPGPRVPVGDKGPDLLRRRRQSGQVIGKAAEERPAISGRRRLEPLRRQSGIDQAVDWRLGPGRRDAGRSRRDHRPRWLERPPGRLLRPSWLIRRRPADRLGRPLRPRVDPVPQQRQLPLAQPLSCRWHLFPRLPARHPSNQLARGALSRNDHRSTHPAPEGRLPLIEPQLPL